MGKLLLLTLNGQEEKAVDKIIAAITDCISLEAVQAIPIPASEMFFPGLEIRHRYLKLSGTWIAIVAIQALPT